MKKVLFFLLFVIVGLLNPLKAQDTIVFKNNSSKIVKITQIKSNEISCKDYSNLEGPDYIYELNKVSEIHFNNGNVQNYNITDEETVFVNDVATKKRDQVEMYKKSSLPPNLATSYTARNEYYKGVPYESEYGDPYNPTVAGVASYFVPGLGQMLSGEVGRGFAFLGGSVATYLVAVIGAAGMSSPEYYYSDYGYINRTTNNNQFLYTTLFVGGLISMITIDIWSIVDAVHVAKVNNLYRRDLYKQQVSIQLSPYVDTNKQMLSLNNQPSLGISMKINF